MRALIHACGRSRAGVGERRSGSEGVLDTASGGGLRVCTRRTQLIVAYTAVVCVSDCGSGNPRYEEYEVKMAVPDASGNARTTGFFLK